MKPVFQAFVAIIALAIVASLILSFSLDGVVGSRIESSTSEMLETRVTVDDVSISILDGKGTISGITIQNPEGFSENPAVQLRQISITLDLSSLLSDTIVVNNISIEKPELFFEQKGTENNLNALMNRMGGSSSSGTNVVIDRLLVENGQVRLTADIGNEEQSAEAAFSRIEVEGIGRSGSGTMQQAMREILEPILRSAAREAVEKGLMNRAKEELKDLIDG